MDEILPLIGLVLLAGCTYFEDLGQSTSPNASCEAKARELVPEYLILYDGLGFSRGVNQWRDGESMQFDLLMASFEMGSETGENASYVYSRDPYDNYPFFRYSKEIIDGNGTVLGIRNFSIWDIELRKVSEPGNISNTYQYYLNNACKNITLQLFEVLSYKFVECNWVSYPSKTLADELEDAKPENQCIQKCNEYPSCNEYCNFRPLATNYICGYFVPECTYNLTTIEEGISHRVYNCTCRGFGTCGITFVEPHVYDVPIEA